MIMLDGFANFQNNLAFSWNDFRNGFDRRIRYRINDVIWMFF